MSKVTRNRLAGLIAGLSVGLLAQQASATEEIVVYGSASSVFKIEPATTLDRNQKPTPAPKVELANNTTPVRG